jgi:hypothetical protein
LAAHRNDLMMMMMMSSESANDKNRGSTRLRFRWCRLSDQLNKLDADWWRSRLDLAPEDAQLNQERRWRIGVASSFVVWPMLSGAFPAQFSSETLFREPDWSGCDNCNQRTRMMTITRFMQNNGRCRQRSTAAAVVVAIGWHSHASNVYRWTHQPKAWMLVIFQPASSVGCRITFGRDLSK